jgi:hypothetical protein
MSAVRWYYAKDGQALGPFDLARLREMVSDGALGPADLVCAEGASEWVAARTVSGLFASPPPLPDGRGKLVACAKCGTAFPGTRACPRCGEQSPLQQPGAASGTDPVPDKYTFTGKLLGQTLAVWFAVGFFSGLCIDASLGSALVIGALTAVLGGSAAGALAISPMADRWYLLRWLNYTLERMGAGACVAGFVVFVLLVVAGGMPVGSEDSRTEQAKAVQSLILRSSVLLGLLVALVAHLVRTWSRVRHADLPTNLREF